MSSEAIKTRPRSKTAFGLMKRSRSNHENLNSPEDNEQSTSKIFGHPIPTAPEDLEDTVPKFFYKLSHYILEKGTKTEGIFRISGSAADMRSLIQIFESGEDPDLDTCAKNVHSVTGLLKKYLKELPEPLLTYELYDMFIAASGIPDQASRLEMVKKVITYLPEGNIPLLIFLVLFLKEIAKHQEVNKMDTSNLAIVFAPSLLKSKTGAKEEVKDSPYAQQVLLLILDEFESIFESPKIPELFKKKLESRKSLKGKSKSTTTVSTSTTTSTSNLKQDEFFEHLRKGEKKEIAEAIQKRSIDLNAFDQKGYSPLMIAAHRGDLEIMDMFIQAGCNIDLQNLKLETALHRSVQVSGRDAVQYLLSKGAQIDLGNEDGQTPLHIASYAGEKEICTLLINQGANVDARDGSRKTPLILATFAGHKSICKLLLESKCSITKVDMYGWTPLMMAAYAGHADIVTVLLDRGASITPINKKGKTATMMAQENDREDIVKLLTSPRVKKRKERRYSSGKVMDDDKELSIETNSPSSSPQPNINSLDINDNKKRTSSPIPSPNNRDKSSSPSSHSKSRSIPSESHITMNGIPSPKSSKSTNLELSPKTQRRNSPTKIITPTSSQGSIDSEKKPKRAAKLSHDETAV